MRFLEIDLTEGGRLDPAILRKLDECARSALELFDEAIGAASKNHLHDIDWWVSRPGTRNSFVSKLFARCAQILLVQTLLQEGWRLKVYVDDSAMVSALRSIAHPALQVEFAARARHRARLAVRIMRDISSSIFHTIFAIAAAKFTRNGRRPLLHRNITALDVFILRDSFSSGTFLNRYYPGLEDALTPDEQFRFVYIPIFYRVRNYFSLFRAMRRSHVNFLPVQDYLKASDYAFAFGHWLRIRKIRTPSSVIFSGINIASLIQAELWNGRFAQSTISALLQFRFWQKRVPAAIKTFVDWYEGQDIDHAAAAAIQWSGKPIEHIAFRPACSRLEISVFPACHEISAGVVPPVMAVTGNGFRREIATCRPSLKTSLAPGFRYAGLTDLNREPNHVPTILVTLPLAEESVEAVAEFLRPLIGDDRLRSYRWLIKRHPAMPKAEVERLFSLSSGQFEFVDGVFHLWLRTVNMVIGLESSALLEAISLNIPSLCLASGNVPTVIPFPDWADRHLWRVCYDTNEARLAIVEMLAGASVAPLSSTLKQDLLSPATRADIRRFLWLD